MPEEPKGYKRSSNFVGIAMAVGKIVASEIKEETEDGGKDKATVALGRERWQGSRQNDDTRETA